jgi:hypothetical protein
MPDNTPAGAPPSLASLFGGLIEDTQQLVRQEVALARREMQEEWTKAKDGGALLGGALVLFALVGVLFGFTLVELLHQYVLPQHLWACHAIVMVLFAVGGGLLFYAARAKLDQVHLVPPQSADSLRKDVQAVTSAVTAPPQSSNLVRHL